MLVKNVMVVLFVFFSVCKGFSQHIYSTHLKGCNTKVFALESESPSAVLDHTVLKNKIQKFLGTENMKKLKGDLKLQIIAYEDGSSCLLSYDNDTNKSEDELNLAALQEYVSKNIVWESVDKNAAVLVELDFKRGEISLKRMGMDGVRGWHELH